MNVPPSNVPPSGDVGERLAALAGQRPWWPLVEATPRWIRVRIGGELVAESRRAAGASGHAVVLSVGTPAAA